MIKIWGRHTSINVQKVLWFMDEIGIEAERVDVGGKHGGLDSAAFGALNPNRKIPVIEDGGVVLWESHAIVRYLADSYGDGALKGTDTATRAVADQWMDWQVSALWPALRVVFLGLIRTPPEERDNDLIARHASQTCDLFKLLDKHLADRDYVAGDKFTIGDIPVGASCFRYLNLDIERPSAPHLDAWYARLQARPPFSERVMIPME